MQKKSKSKVPSIVHHKARNADVVFLRDVDGKRRQIYLGPQIGLARGPDAGGPTGLCGGRASLATKVTQAGERSPRIGIRASECVV